MESTITQLGIGGIFALLIIREVFAFTKEKRNGKSNSGYRSKDSCNEIVKRFDMSFTDHGKRFDKIDMKLDEVKTLIRNGHE